MAIVSRADPAFGLNTFLTECGICERGSTFIRRTCVHRGDPHVYHTDADAAGRSMSMVKGYCVKCRQSREIKDAKPVKLKNGKPAMKGKCPVCGTGMMRIGAVS